MRRVLVRLGIALAVLLALLVVIAPPLLHAPLTREVERRMAGTLPGHTIHVGDVRLRPLTLAIELRDLRVTQDTHPDPPLVEIPHVRTGLRWLPLLRARLAAVAVADGPMLRANRTQLSEAMRDQLVPRLIDSSRHALEQTGVVIDDFVIRDGTVRYFDGDGAPLEARGLGVHVRNIRPPTVGGDPRPSELAVAATVPGGAAPGAFHLHGRGDMLAYPDPPLGVDFEVSRLPLARVAPIAARFGVAIHGGTVSATGYVDTARDHTDATLHDVTVDDLALDYEYRGPDFGKEREGATRAAAKVRARARQNVHFHVGRARVRHATFGVVNHAAKVPYRLFVSDTTIAASNLSDHFRTGPAAARVRGKLMGTGDLRVDTTLRPDRSGPDFDLQVDIRDTDLTTMNDLFQSTAKLTVASGTMEFYAEVHARDGQVQGYAKPLLGHVKVAQSDASPFDRAYKGAMNAVVGVFENRNEQVATRTSLSGPLENPKVGTWEAIVGVVKNAYVKAILPGLER